MGKIPWQLLYLIFLILLFKKMKWSELFIFNFLYFPKICYLNPLKSDFFHAKQIIYLEMLLRCACSTPGPVISNQLIPGIAAVQCTLATRHIKRFYFFSRKRIHHLIYSCMYKLHAWIIESIYSAYKSILCTVIVRTS